jgi:hypothetical protein
MELHLVTLDERGGRNGKCYKERRSPQLLFFLLILNSSYPSKDTNSTINNRFFFTHTRTFKNVCEPTLYFHVELYLLSHYSIQPLCQSSECIPLYPKLIFKVTALRVVLLADLSPAAHPALSKLDIFPAD